MAENRRNTCLNCNTLFAEDAQYCHLCGQSKRAATLSVRELWENFWTTIFNVDNSFFTTLRLIARPDKLTELYVAGKRKKHINPVRLFLISLVFFIGAMTLIIGNFGDSSFLKNLNRDYYNSLLLEKYEDVVGEIEFTDIQYNELEKIKAKVFKGVTCSDVDTIFTGMRIVDFGKFSSITKKDFMELTEEEVYKKYNAKTFFEKLNYRQYIRVNKDPNATNKFLFNNALWGLVPCILILSFFLKLLYRNHKIPYLEHLVFVLNTHSFLFLFWLVVGLFGHWFVKDFNSVSWIVPAAIFSNIVFVFIVMFLYYKEGFFRSLLKYGLALFIYAFLSLVFVIITTLISGFII